MYKLLNHAVGAWEPRINANLIYFCYFSGTCKKKSQCCKSGKYKVASNHSYGNVESILRLCIESVDSICRDSTDMQ